MGIGGLSRDKRWMIIKVFLKFVGFWLALKAKFLVLFEGLMQVKSLAISNIFVKE